MSWKIIEHPNERETGDEVHCICSTWPFCLPTHPFTKFFPAHKVKPSTPELVLDNSPSPQPYFPPLAIFICLFPHLFKFRITDSILTLNSWLSPPSTLKSLQTNNLAFCPSFLLHCFASTYFLCFW